MMQTLTKSNVLLRAIVPVLALGAMLPNQVAAQAAKATDNSPLTLPDHHYDLPGVLITTADQQAHLKKMLAAKLEDTPMNMVKAGGPGDKHQMGISIVYREKGLRPPSVVVHDDVAEVYFVFQGRGHMKVGGKIVDWKRRPVSAGNGRGSAGTKVEGAQDFTITTGDVLMIPAGTPHMWVSSDEPTAYIVVRVDPEGVAPLLELGKAEYKPSIQR
jgi:mannose-6-phosphate isomerase-like protein (cupin superfamily)